MLTAVALDLDDTLFLERDFVRSGFRAVARRLSERLGSSRDWFAMLWAGFEAGVRGDAFNRVLEAAGVDATREMIDELVRCYREHVPDIAPPADVVPALQALGLLPGRLGIITDGPVAVQQRKFRALGIEPLVSHVICTDAWGTAFRKPHPRAFEQFESLTGCGPEQCAYVADNPAKDFRAPHRRGWTTVRVARPGGLHSAEPAAPGEVDHTLTDLGALPAIVRGGEN